MKKNFLSIAVLAIVLGVASCKSSSSSSFEGDVKKLAEYQCKEMQLMAKDPGDEKAKKELEDLEKEMKEFKDKMQEKYKDKENDKEMNEKGNKIVKDIMDKCK